METYTIEITKNCDTYSPFTHAWYLIVDDAIVDEGISMSYGDAEDDAEKSRVELGL
jgi:hypothetical protein